MVHSILFQQFTLTKEDFMLSFKELPLPQQLQKALTQLSFEIATEIQCSVIPVAMNMTDLMACAETGSGKTAAYGIPIVSQLLADPHKKALILVPTRELAQQITDVFRDLAQYCDGFQVTPLVGGADIRKQFKALKRKPRIVVATPGRLIDHLNQKTISLKTTEILVLDEGDRMLDMGFAPQLDEILKHLPSKRQTSLFTATLPEKVQKLAEKYLFQPKVIRVGRDSLPVSTVKQSVIQVSTKDKDDRIVDELNQRKGSVIVFAKTRHRTDRLAKNLLDFGFSVGLIHGGRTQGQRNLAIQNFKNRRCRILCATDVAARGIDIPLVEHVINFDLPVMTEDYVHRIGRTARNGASGEAVSFVTPDEHSTWHALARKYKIEGIRLKSSSKVITSKSKKPFKMNDNFSNEFVFQENEIPRKPVKKKKFQSKTFIKSGGFKKKRRNKSKSI